MRLLHPQLSPAPDSYPDEISVLKRGLDAQGLSFREIHDGPVYSGKGGLGQFVEKYWFHYDPNSNPEADFQQAGVELKVTPCRYTKKNELRAKERLVCDVINYMEEYKAHSLMGSGFWKKCQTMLLMVYRYDDDIDIRDFRIEFVFLLHLASLPDEDKSTFAHDWAIIVGKIKAGKAHEISEGDTCYLAACTKGAKGGNLRRQPFSAVPARQRAYSLKNSYMTVLINEKKYGIELEQIASSAQLQKRTFEEYVDDAIRPYIGKSIEELRDLLGLHYNPSKPPKNLTSLVVNAILRLKGKLCDTDEFAKADITVKTITVEKSGLVKQSMSFPAFRPLELIRETWEDSTFGNLLRSSRFFFIVFRRDGTTLRLEKTLFWNMPAADLHEAEKVWQRTVDLIRDNKVVLTPEVRKGKTIIRNNLPSMAENEVAHVRPHGRDASDTVPLPDGRTITRPCFWLGNKYIKRIIGV